MLGFLHALEVDHMLAVSAFVSRRPTVPLAARFGARWGVGHSLAVLATGGLLLALGVRWPERWDALGEAAVGAMLVGLGLWTVRSAGRLHSPPDPAHGLSHPHDHARSGITAVGFVHGLAGTSAVVALVPVTLMTDVRVGLGYLTAFGAGVTAAMTLFAMGAAFAMQRAEARSVILGQRVATMVGAAGILTGGFWIARALA